MATAKCECEHQDYQHDKFGCWATTSWYNGRAIVCTCNSFQLSQSTSAPR